MDEKGYHKLQVWNETHSFILGVYKISKNWPKDELFGLTNQIRRASVSIAANIVEGHARSSRKERLQFLNIANGSLVEVEYYLELARDLAYITSERYQTLERQRFLIGKLLHGFIKALRVLDS